MKKKDLRECFDFIKLQEYMESIFLKIDERIEKQQNQKNDYDIYCSVVQRGKYDVTNHIFFPMRKEDLKEIQIEAETMRFIKDGNEFVPLFTVFAWDGQSVVTEIHNKQNQFQGTAFVEDGQYPILVNIRPCEKYKDCISELYFTTVTNGIAWKPINESFLEGFYDVYLISANLPKNKQIKKVEIDFGVYSSVMKFDCFPVWNIQQLLIQSEAKKEGDGKSVLFRHKLFNEKVKEDIYLVEDRNSLFTNHIHVDGTVVSCVYDMEKEWKILRVIQNTIYQKGYPVWDNRTILTEGKKNIINHKKKVVDLYLNHFEDDKQFIWEYALDEYKWEVFFEQLEQWSPYVEIHEIVKNQGYICRYNAMFQYEEFFQGFYEYDKYPAMIEEKVFVDIVTHFIAELDAKRGYSLETYLKEKFEEDLCNGFYGEKCKGVYLEISTKKRKIILHFLMLQDEMHRHVHEAAGSFDLYVKTVIGLLGTGVVYQKKQDKNSFFIYLGIKQSEEAEKLLYLAKMLFLPIGYKVKIFWKKHFAVFNEKETLKMGEIQLI